MAAKFHKRSYEAVAEVLSNLRPDDVKGPAYAQWAATVADFVVMFKADNFAFDMQRFMAACTKRDGE